MGAITHRIDDELKAELKTFVSVTVLSSRLWFKKLWQRGLRMRMI